LRFLDSLKEQLKQAQTTMKTLNKEPDKDLMKALEDYIKEVDTLEDRLSARNEGLGFGGRSGGG
jgi:5-bromo-4-chloroindolyl phosphate hydrolysis protein